MITRRGDGLLNTVGDATDAWETSDVAGLVDALDQLRKWFRVLSKGDIERLREELLQGTGPRKAMSKRIVRAMRGAMDVIDGDVKAKIVGI